MNQTPSQRNSFFTSLYSKRITLRTKLIAGFSLIAALAAFITAFAIYTNTERQLFENFRRRVLTAVAITALQQNGDEFENITSGSEPLYEKFRLQNLQILKSDPDFVFVYTMRKDPQGIYFVVDGNELDAEGFSPYGDRYLEPSTFLVENFDSMTQPFVEPEIYTDEFGSFLSAYAPIRSSDGRRVGVIGMDIAADTIVQQQRQTLIQSIVVFLAVLGLGIILGTLAGNALTRPVTKLAQGTLAFASGKFGQRVDINTHDEIGDLAKIFNSMAGEIQNLIGSLEKRVVERTADLDTARLTSEQRAFELQTIGEISTIISSEKNIDTLLPLVTRLVSERFGFYHVGIFLIDETKQFALLQAANSEGGQKMLARSHKLEVGTTSIVGYATKTGESRIALDVGTDSVFFNNPDLPNTRSEMALPLITRGQTIGALDVQSEKPGAFTENDANTLSILADQIATAIENARLFDQTQHALSEAQTLYSQYVRESWGALAQEESLVGYHQSLAGGKKLTEPVDSDDIREAMNRGRLLVLHADGNKGEPAIVVPVKLRGQIIGALNIKAPSRDHQWSQDEIDLAESISERLSLALENARLFEETTRRAERERLVSEITTKIRSTNDPQEMIKTAVMELQRALGATHVEIIPQKSSLSPDK